MEAQENRPLGNFVESKEKNGPARRREIIKYNRSGNSVAIWRVALSIHGNQFTGRLLVTTRQTRRWIVPKGWPIKGLKPPRSAAREAYEEGGIRGTVGAKAIGVFSYDKALDANGVTVPCEVRVFPMIVKRQFDSWPEANE